MSTRRPGRRAAYSRRRRHVASPPGPAGGDGVSRTLLAPPAGAAPRRGPRRRCPRHLKLISVILPPRPLLCRLHFEDPKLGQGNVAFGGGACWGVLGRAACNGDRSPTPPRHDTRGGPRGPHRHAGGRPGSNSISADFRLSPGRSGGNRRDKGSGNKTIITSLRRALRRQVKHLAPGLKCQPRRCDSFSQRRP